jgi:CBS domain-containing protein
MTTDVSPGSDRVSLLIGAPVARVGPDATLREVAAAMVERCVGALVVGERAVDPAGIVSERDLVRALAEDRDPATTRARDIATTKLLWCDADATIAEVAAEMMDAYVRHVLVEDGGHLVGIVSARDVLGAYASADLGDIGWAVRR